MNPRATRTRGRPNRLRSSLSCPPSTSRSTRLWKRIAHTSGMECTPSLDHLFFPARPRQPIGPRASLPIGHRCLSILQAEAAQHRRRGTGGSWGNDSDVCGSSPADRVRALARAAVNWRSRMTRDTKASSNASSPRFVSGRISSAPTGSRTMRAASPGCR